MHLRKVWHSVEILSSLFFPTGVWFPSDWAIIKLTAFLLFTLETIPYPSFKAWYIVAAMWQLGLAGLHPQGLYQLMLICTKYTCMPVAPPPSTLKGSNPCVTHLIHLTVVPACRVFLVYL